jgi:hypothetical protein
MALKAIIATLVLGTSSLAMAAPGGYQREARVEHRVQNDRREIRQDRREIRRDHRIEGRMEHRRGERHEGRRGRR